MKKRIIAVFFLISCLAAFLCSCGFSEFANEADTQVRNCLDYLAERNIEAMYELMFPESIDYDSFKEICDQMVEYCPLTKDYQIKKTYINVGSRVGTEKSKVVQCRYDLNFEDKEYVLFTAYTKREEDCGITQFRLITRTEYESAINQK